LPISREKATQIPMVPGSSIKGVFRDNCADGVNVEQIFGSAPNATKLSMGAVTFTDARLLLIPIRSLRGVFAWVTSPLLLQRLVRDARDVQGVSELPAVPTPAQEGCLVAPESGLKLNDSQVVLEDLQLSCTESKDVADWADWFGKTFFADDQLGASVKARLCIIPDDILSFLLETATEITARISIDDEKKTVKDSALWYEEALPAETVLVSLVVASKIKEDVFDAIEKTAQKPLQIGGKATVGRGLCKATLV
jgi:CRISPR-associated protein Cmr4